MQGFFITVEGGEGAGKSTLMEHLSRWLAERGQIVVETREPGGTRLAEQIRDIVLGHHNTELCDQTELLLVFAARAQHLDEKIRPALQRGETVLCDRFTDATWAYQGGGRGMSSRLIQDLETMVHGDLQPDLTLLLDLPVKQGLRRASRRGEADRIERESLEFFERVRRAYLERAHRFPGRFAVIDASLDVDSVWLQAKQALEERLGR